MAYDIAALLKIIGTSLDDVAASVSKTSASALDDISASAKLAGAGTKAAAGVVIDDAAAMPQHAVGLSPLRELPVVWAIAKGSSLNKAILVPLALLLSIIAPWLIPPLLFIGGAYLCYEGFEGLLKKFWHHENENSHDASMEFDATTVEKIKIKTAIKTDFVLSAEIVVIALGKMTQATLATKTLALVIASLSMTIGVYGVVAIIVKADDIGLHLFQKGLKKGNRLLQRFGKWIVDLMPMLLNGLSNLGTAAMLLVGGGIIAHHLPFVENLSSQVGIIYQTAGFLMTLLVGIFSGMIVVGLQMIFSKLFIRR